MRDFLIRTIRTPRGSNKRAELARTKETKSTEKTTLDTEKRKATTGTRVSLRTQSLIKVGTETIKASTLNDVTISCAQFEVDYTAYLVLHVAVAALSLI